MPVIFPSESPTHKVVSVGGLITPGFETSGTKIVTEEILEQPAALVTTTVTVD